MLKKLLYVLLLLFNFKTILAKIKDSEHVNMIENKLIDSAVEIANANFNFLKITGVTSKDVDLRIVDQFLKAFNGPVVIETKKIASPPEQVVIIAETWRSFLKLLTYLKPDLKGRTLLSSGAKFLIVLVKSHHGMNRITKILWSYRATDAIIVANLKNKTAMFSYFPYLNYLNCQNTEPYLVGYWDENRKKQIYPDKMKNMNGCPLYISTNKVYHPSTEVKSSLQLLKTTMIKLLRNAMNFTPIISYRDYISIDSDEAKNWSSSLNDVISGVANLSTCSIPLGIDRLGLLDYSAPYVRVRLVWLAPPVTLGPLWWRLLSPLNGYLWLGLLIILFYVTSLPFALKLKPIKEFCYKYFKNIDKVQRVTIRIWGVMLGQPIIVEPRRFRDFYIISLWIWFTFVIRNAYQSVLIGALKTDTYVGAFVDLKETVEEGYRFGGRAGVYTYFEFDPLIRDRFEVIAESRFEEVFRDVIDGKRKFVLATSMEYSSGYCLSQGRKEDECGHILPDSIITVPLVIWMKMYSPFKRPLEVWLPRLMESGLLERNSIKKINRNVKTSDPTPLTQQQMISCFLCLFFGYSMATVMFIFELIRHKTKKLHVWKSPWISVKK